MRSLLVVTALLGLASSACTSITLYRGPLEELSKGAVATRTAVATLANNVNGVAVRNRAWVAAAKSQRFGARELTPLIDPAFVRARVAGLAMIERLAAQMLRVLDDENDPAADKPVIALAADAKELAGVLGKGDAAKAYAEPLGTLAQIVMDLHAERHRKEILDAAIKKGVPAARAVLAVLEQDFKPGSKTSLDAVKREELEALRTEQIHAYDTLLAEEASLSPAERGALPRVEGRYRVLARVIATQRILDQNENEGVYATLVALDESLGALLAVASKSEVRPADLKALAERLGAFSKSAEALLATVKTLEQATPTGEGK